MIKRVIVIAIIVIGIGVTAFLWYTADLNHVENSSGLVKVNADNNNDEDNDDDSTQNKVQLKSAIITLQSTVPFLGADIETKVYLDDYGNKYCTITDTKEDYRGKAVVTTQISVISNGFDYEWDPEKKEGTKTINTDNFNPTKINFSKLDPSTMESYGMKKEGHDSILGKLCTVYSINIPTMQLSGTYYVWHNISLRTKTNVGNESMDMAAVKVEENVKIPAKVFQIPKDVVFDVISNDTTKSLTPSASKLQ